MKLHHLTTLRKQKHRGHSSTPRRIGLAALAGGLAFVGATEAVEVVVDGSFENTQASSLPVVKTGGKTNPGLGGGWSIFSTYAYSTSYTMPLTNGLGVAIGGAQFLRPYAPGTYGVALSSETVTQLVSLTASTSLTPAKIDAGQGAFSLSAWFCTYRGDNDNSDLTLSFLDANGSLVGNPVLIGGADFVAALPSGDNGRFGNARFWGQDIRTETIPPASRNALITIQSHSLSGAPDGYVDLVSLDITDASQGTPVLATADPPDKAVSVGPVLKITVGLQDRVTAVDTNSIRLYLDNALVSPTILKQDTNTVVTYAAGLLPALSQHTYAISYADNGSPPTVKSNSFQFTMANYLTLPASLNTPLGSEDATKPGFNLRVYQVDSLIDPNAARVNLVDSIEFNESVLAGQVGANVADTTAAASGNTFIVTNTAHWANSSGTSPNFPNPDPFPGIPGMSATEDNFVDELLTYVRFPAAGYYQMGVNNNDDLRLSASTNGTFALKISGPTNMVIPSVPIATNITQLLFGGSLPLTPLSAPVVYATPSGDPNDACYIGTNTALAGKIALVDRGGTNCAATDQSAEAYQAQLAGAVAVLLTTPGDTGYPNRLTGAPAFPINIPVLVVADSFGAGLMKSYLTNNIAVTATIQGDPSPRIAEWNGPKGFGNVDVLTGFAVPAAGLYPLRLLTGHATGGANLEWFAIQPDGTRILINDTTNPNSLKAFRARTESPAKQPVLNMPSVAGNKVTISWTGSGTLQEAPSVTGPWTTSPVQDNPQTVTVQPGLKLYRVHQ